jgi:hypothetical protein
MTHKYENDDKVKPRNVMRNEENKKKIVTPNLVSSVSSTM